MAFLTIQAAPAGTRRVRGVRRGRGRPLALLGAALAAARVRRSRWRAGSFPLLSGIVLVVCPGLALVPLLPARARESWAAVAAAVPALGFAASSVLLVTVAAVGISLTGLSIRLALGALIAAGALLLPAGEPDQPLTYEDAWAIAGLLGALLVGILLPEPGDRPHAGAGQRLGPVRPLRGPDPPARLAADRQPVLDGRHPVPPGPQRAGGVRLLSGDGRAAGQRADARDLGVRADEHRRRVRARAHAVGRARGRGGGGALGRPADRTGPARLARPGQRRRARADGAGPDVRGLPAKRRPALRRGVRARAGARGAARGTPALVPGRGRRRGSRSGGGARAQPGAGRARAGHRAQRRGRARALPRRGVHGDRRATASSAAPRATAPTSPPRSTWTWWSAT